MEIGQLRLVLNGVAALGLAFTTQALGDAHRASHLDDEDFGIHADAPAGKTMCFPDEQGHGFLIPLEDPSEAVACDPQRMGARLDVYFAYNVPYEARSTGELAAHACHHGRYRSSPYRIDGTRFVRCVENRWQPLPSVDYIVLRPHRERPDVPDAEVGVSLICPKNDCAKHTAALTELINSMRSIPVPTTVTPGSAPQ